MPSFTIHFPHPIDIAALLAFLCLDHYTIAITIYFATSMILLMATNIKTTLMWMIGWPILFALSFGAVLFGLIGSANSHD